MPKEDNRMMPQASKSYWIDAIGLPKFPHLEENMHTDVAIVGGGITGVTAAYLLTEKEYNVTLRG
ncbi:FAD-dependent oxidoreductase [Lentibacillus sp. N15]|uniref:FAD-dependent oxidoreductase n=1 Tax=Lentibacillus songyuanensis TaxID=3136161 RepID=UPI0031BB8FA2